MIVGLTIKKEWIEHRVRSLYDLSAKEYDIIQKALEYYAMKLQPEEGPKEDAELAYAMFDEMKQNKG